MSGSIVQALILGVPTSGAQTAAATPTFSIPAPGPYAPGQQLSITSSTAGNSIYYTTNGDTPTYPITNSTQQYGPGPITLNQSETVQAIAVAPGYLNSAVASATYTITNPTGATQVFNYQSFTSLAPFSVYSDSSSAGTGVSVQNGQIYLGVPTNNSTTTHTAQGLWYATQQPNSSWTTTFSFYQTGAPVALTAPSLTSGGMCVAGFTIGMQNSTSPPLGSSTSGNKAVADSNCCGWGTYAFQGGSPNNAVAVKFDLNYSHSIKFNPSTGSACSTGLYVNPGGYTAASESNGYGGPSGGLDPYQDLNPYGINFYKGNLMSVTIVYDGATNKLVSVIKDTVTNAQSRFEYSVNIPQITGASNSWLGFTEGQAGEPIGSQTRITTWAFYKGFNTRLSTPTPSFPPGNYGTRSTLTVSLTAGTNVSIFYTVNGLLPTSSSTAYTGPINLTANTVLYWVAIENNYTDSFVGGGLYVVNNSHSISITAGNFVNGCGVIPIGYAYFSGGALTVNDQATVNFAAGSAVGINARVGNAWFSAPVTITGNWTTTFVFTCTGGGDGFTFIAQAPYQPPSAPNIDCWGGCNGPFISAPGVSGSLGYGGYTASGNPNNQSSPGILNSFAVKFNVFESNKTGLYLNGALPEDGNGTAIGSWLNNGAATTCTFTYTQGTNNLNMVVTQGANNFQTNLSLNVSTALNNSSTATVGFGASAGGSKITLNILSWTGF